MHAHTHVLTHVRMVAIGNTANTPSLSWQHVYCAAFQGSSSSRSNELCQHFHTPDLPTRHPLFPTPVLPPIPQFLRKLAPPTDPYLHNDLHLREAPEVGLRAGTTSCAPNRL